MWTNKADIVQISRKDLSYFLFRDFKISKMPFELFEAGSGGQSRKQPNAFQMTSGQPIRLSGVDNPVGALPGSKKRSN